MVQLTNLPTTPASAALAGRRGAAPADPVARYRVVAESWMEDAHGLSELRAEGAEVELTDAQANFLLLSGQIEPVAPIVPAAAVAPARAAPPKPAVRPDQA